MAMIDYGCLMFRNGNLISNGMFTPMKDTCGFVDEEFEHQYFGVCGDEEFFVGFYKHQISYKYNGKIDHIWVNCSEHNGPAFISCKWKEMKIMPSGKAPLLTITKRNGFYVCKFEYKGDKYKIFFGLGVDYDWYKKSRLVNYFRTNPTYLWHSFYRKIKWFVQDWRMYHNG